jgi:hypothetical protein
VRLHSPKHVDLAQQMKGRVRRGDTTITAISGGGGRSLAYMERGIGRTNGEICRRGGAVAVAAPKNQYRKAAHNVICDTGNHTCDAWLADEKPPAEAAETRPQELPAPRTAPPAACATTAARTV